MAKWEYKLVRQWYDKHDGVLSKSSWGPPINLQELGKSRWELVSVTPIALGQNGRTSSIRYYFKRLISN
ncbi:MAG: hypothetical protein ACPG8W_18075 [Candidatus Promineifilaceae bacterium]